jgi:hypothetical protein
LESVERANALGQTVLPDQSLRVLEVSNQQPNELGSSMPDVIQEPLSQNVECGSSKLSGSDLAREDGYGFHDADPRNKQGVARIGPNTIDFR